MPGGPAIPALVAAAGERAQRRFLEFFTATIRNPHTRRAYGRAVAEFLSNGANGGGRAVDGLTMLVGQAARAFELFFGAPAPPPDEALRDLLTTVMFNSA